MGKAAFGNKLLPFARATLSHPEKLLLVSVFFSDSDSDYSMEAGGQGEDLGGYNSLQCRSRKTADYTPVTRCSLLFARVKAAISLAGETGKAVCTRNPNTDIGADPGKRFTVISINSLSPHGNNL